MMKRFLISTLATVLSIATAATAATAMQVSPTHDAADLDGDGTVTLTELKRFNRDQRQT